VFANNPRHPVGGEGVKSRKSPAVTFGSAVGGQIIRKHYGNVRGTEMYSAPTVRTLKQLRAIYSTSSGAAARRPLAVQSEQPTGRGVRIWGQVRHGLDIGSV
jgi:hypothetical protein